MARETAWLPLPCRVFSCSGARGTMTPYVFEVLKDGAVIDTRSVVLPHIRYAWAEIAQLAKSFDGQGHKIRVKDEDGGIVILTGVGAVRRRLA